MDPRNRPGNHSWSRPPSQPSIRDTRQQATMPAPLYTLQGPPPPLPPPPPPSSVQRPQPYFNNDLFFSRKVDRIGPGQDSQTSRPSYSIGGLLGGEQQSASSLPREVPGPRSVQEREQVKQGAWTRFADGRDDRYKPLGAEAPSQLPPPPPPSTGYRPSLEALHASDDLARQQGPRTSSPRMYGAQSSHPPLPPPLPPPAPVNYSGRHARTPSSPQYGPAPLHRDHPPQSPIGRDLPPLPANARPSSSMSILSMLGTDPGRPAREPSVPTYAKPSQPNGSLNSLIQYSTSAVSPTKPPNGSSADPQGTSPTHNAYSTRPFRAYSGGSVGSGKRSSPSANALRFGLSPTDSPTSVQHLPRSAGAQERMPEHSRHVSAARSIDRPSSQPAGHNSSAIDFDRRARELDAKREELARQEEALARTGTGFSDRSRISTLDLLGRQRHEPLGQNAQPATQGSLQDDRIHSSSYPFLSNSSVFGERTSKEPRAEYSYTPRERMAIDDKESQHLSQKSPFDADALRRLREERLGATASQQQQELHRTPSIARPRFLDNFENRQDQAENRRLSSVSSATAMERTRSIDSVGRTSEDLNNHRHSLAIMLDNGKRGRISPLPQAVQGAQSRPSNTPSRDPGIKNEFSRMFAGIGSGVTGVGGSGASTPFPPSPRQSVENEQRPFGPPSEVVKIPESRNGSRMGKRRTKTKDDEVDNNDGRMVGVSVDGRGVKRAKHNHRHHVHGHRHHRDEGTPLRNVSNPSALTPTPHHNHHVHHHHHHADGTIHHHHHTHTKQIAQPVEKLLPPPRVPKTVINNQAVLSALINHPRHHLGSTVYAPVASSTTSPASLTLKANDMTSTYCIPPQLGKENCTLTVRVPRYYLTHSSLLHITSRRAVWGTDIYTDDSDPVCAAIHAGWIRGAWPGAIDISMLEPSLQNVSLAADAVEAKDVVLNGPPSTSPMHVPLGKDMHITLVILPALQSYNSRVIHGVKSRAWGADHDGLSFKIEKIAFLNEGDGAGEEKSAAARKKRISASAAAAARPFDGTMPPPIRLRLGTLKRPTMKAAMRPVAEVVAVA